MEADIRDSSQVYRLPSGKKVVGACEKKTGAYSVLDARDGLLIRLYSRSA
jgi:hypothetical protein